MDIDYSTGEWINPPLVKLANREFVEILTEPHTDFWQRTYYGFRNNNAPALLLTSKCNFTFTARLSFDYKNRFDQCGLIIFMDDENWFKVSIEYECSGFSRLGSVVTNQGYSDWATTDVPTATSIWYRLSRRGPDFLIEYSSDGKEFLQMRIFHLLSLGETTSEMGKQPPPLLAEQDVRFGVYACSPDNSSFTARFTDFSLIESIWMPH